MPQTNTAQRAKVFGPPHPDGGDYSPICDTHSPDDARAIAEVPNMIETLNDAVRVMTHAVPAGRYATASRLNVKHKIVAILKRIEG